MIRIYVQNKPLLLTDSITTEIETQLNQHGALCMTELNEQTVRKTLEDLEKTTIPSAVIVHRDVDQTLDAFKKQLTLISAAGGMVYTPSKEILLIFRKGKWDLPKGKLDEGESLEMCAQREVREETGVADLEIQQPLVVTYHTYREWGKHILKESHWYLMQTPHIQNLTPQTEEDIEKCEWVPLANLRSYTSNMHASIIDVVREGEKALSGK